MAYCDDEPVTITGAAIQEGAMATGSDKAIRPPKTAPATTKRRQEPAARSGGEARSPRVRRDIRTLARAHSAAALAALVAVINDAEASPAARVSAATVLLTWGHGRAGGVGKGSKDKDAKAETVRLVWGGPPLPPR
jgi:hypothetical protein